MAFVLVSDTLGVYLGETVQPFQTFWSGVQPLSVDEAPCFDSTDEVAKVIRGWGRQDLEFLKALRPATVVPDILVSGLKYASPDACARAGIQPWLNESLHVPLPCDEADADAVYGEEEQRWQRPMMN